MKCCGLGIVNRLFTETLSQHDAVVISMKPLEQFIIHLRHLLNIFLITLNAVNVGKSLTITSVKSNLPFLRCMSFLLLEHFGFAQTSMGLLI